MKPADLLRFTWGALVGYRVRTALMLLAMSIGVAAVVVLTALGEGARRYVVDEFASMGSNLLIVVPGRTETAGTGPGMFIGETPRDLTLEDAQALLRAPAVRQAAPMVIGAAPVSHQQREREVTVMGTSADFANMRDLNLSIGKFLPEEEWQRASPVCVIGAKVRDELFVGKSPLGEWVRIGDHRFRVIGVLASEGVSLGINMDDMVMVPVASAQSLFNKFGLFRIFVEAKSRNALDVASKQITRIITERHQGEEDITVISQDAMLGAFDDIFQALTFSVAGIAAISLGVAGILVMNVMLVAISQRTAEIGLLKAVGARPRQILLLFLGEAAMLSLLGSLIGLLVGETASWYLGWLYPSIPFGAPLWAVFAAVGVALSTGLLFAVMPARRAARLDAVEALAKRH